MMINRRRACGGKSLPYDAEVEYLIFNKCSVNTGIKPSTNYKYYWKYLWTDRANYTYIFTNGGSSGNWFMFGGIEASNRTHIHIKSSTSLNSNIINANTLYEGSFMRNGNNMEVRLNNTLMASLAYMDFQSSRNLIINDYRDFNIYMYNFSIYNENDVLILGLIPVRVGTTGYMYDKVSGQLFSNNGTGSFIVGPDVN